MFFGFEDSLKDLKKELSSVGMDIPFIKDWQKSYDKVKKQTPVLQAQYTQAKADLECAYHILQEMEQVLISGKMDMISYGKSLKQFKNSFNHEFLIGKEDREFHLTYQTILTLCDKQLSAQKDVLILQSEVENLLAVAKEALEKDWPQFRAMAFFYIDRTDKEICDLPHSDKVEKVQKIYENEFIKPMEQVLESAFGVERAKQVMEVELWI